MKRVRVFCLFLDFAHEGRQEQQEHKLDGGAIIALVVLVVQRELFGAESLGGLDCVARVALDNVGHQQLVFGVGKVSDSVHSAISEMLPNGFLEVNETAGWGEKGCHAGAAVVVIFLRGAGVNGSEFIRGSELVAGTWI